MLVAHGRMIAEGAARESSPSKEICVLTFTNKTARELKHRVSQDWGPLQKVFGQGLFTRLVEIGHNHYKGQSARITGVIDQSDCQSLLKELVKRNRVVGKKNLI